MTPASNDSAPCILNRRKRNPVSDPTTGLLPEGSKVKLEVTTGLRKGKSYALRQGVTYVGRKGPFPVDVDLTEQENPGKEVAANRFSLIWLDASGLAIADTRGVTFLNGVRLPTGKRFPLAAEDTLRFGKTVLQVKVIVKKRTGVQK
jgi:hypothetical protein